MEDWRKGDEHAFVPLTHGSLSFVRSFVPPVLVV